MQHFHNYFRSGLKLLGRRPWPYSTVGGVSR